ncbi:MAG: hypothetical protein HYV34_04740 [Candidatus Kerfeldbacteria bacterium]|nr:hypothetical protein [Candidatus Kerfeldbacteria bacterium]
MNSKTIEELKKHLSLSENQREILVGLLLGDGHLETQNYGRTYRLKIEHCTQQKEYIIWLYERWSEWVHTPPQKKVQRIHDREYEKYFFNTLSHGAFRFYAHEFYRNHTKVVPRFIHRWLTPQAFAIWFMDDGSIKSQHHNARILNTQGFTKRDVRRLALMLQKNFGLETSLRKQREGYQIMIAGKSSQRLRSILDPYILPSMRYKLPREGNTLA